MAGQSSFLMMIRPIKTGETRGSPSYLIKMVAKDFQGFVWQLFVVILSALNIVNPQKAFPASEVGCQQTSMNIHFVSGMNGHPFRVILNIHPMCGIKCR